MLFERPLGFLLFTLVLWWYALALHVMSGVATILEFGFPHFFDEQKNLYPAIIPLALVLLAWATGTVRFGRKPSDSNVASGPLVVHADPTDPERSGG